MPVDNSVGFMGLVCSDVSAYYGKVSLKNILKALTNPSTKAAFWLRVATSSNKLGYIFARNRLVKCYGIDIGPRTSIGPGLRMPHPVGIVFGEGVSVLGELTIYQNCTLGNKRGYPQIGRGVTIYPGSCLVGGISVGDGATIGAMSFLDKTIAPGATYHSQNRH